MRHGLFPRAISGRRRGVEGEACGLCVKILHGQCIIVVMTDLLRFSMQLDRFRCEQSGG